MDQAEKKQGAKAERGQEATGQRVCHVCQAAAAVRCDGCSDVWWCGKACQERDFVHAITCRMVSAAGDDLLRGRFAERDMDLELAIARSLSECSSSQRTPEQTNALNGGDTGSSSQRTPEQPSAFDRADTGKSAPKLVAQPCRICPREAKERCADCRAVWYCGSACKAADAEHGEICGGATRLGREREDMRFKNLRRQLLAAQREIARLADAEQAALRGQRNLRLEVEAAKEREQIAARKEIETGRKYCELQERERLISSIGVGSEALALAASALRQCEAKCERLFQQLQAARAELNAIALSSFKSRGRGSMPFKPRGRSSVSSR